MAEKEPILNKLIGKFTAHSEPKEEESELERLRRHASGNIRDDEISARRQIDYMSEINSGQSFFLPFSSTPGGIFADEMRIADILNRKPEKYRIQMQAEAQAALEPRIVPTE